ncbi:hypothetical protein D3C80_1082050 [compost metagenome]
MHCIKHQRHVGTVQDGVSKLRIFFFEDINDFTVYLIPATQIGFNRTIMRQNRVCNVGNGLTKPERLGQCTFLERQVLHCVDRTTELIDLLELIPNNHNLRFGLTQDDIENTFVCVLAFIQIQDFVTRQIRFRKLIQFQICIVCCKDIRIHIDSKFPQTLGRFKNYPAIL